MTDYDIDTDYDELAECGEFGPSARALHREHIRLTGGRTHAELDELVREAHEACRALGMDVPDIG